METADRPTVAVSDDAEGDARFEELLAKSEKRIDEDLACGSGSFLDRAFYHLFIAHKH